MKHRRLTKRQIRLFVIILAIIGLFLAANICLTVFLYMQQPRTKEIIKFRHMTNTEINKEIEWHFRNGYSEIVYHFYEEIIGSRENTIALINSALLHGIPLHKSIAQSWVESQHKAWAIGYNKRPDGTIWSRDIGLKQGNEYTFRNDPVKKMLDPFYNLSRCDLFLRQQYEKYGNWNRALVAYNRGMRLDEDGFRYMEDVLRKEAELDNEFNIYFPIVEELDYL